MAEAVGIDFGPRPQPVGDEADLVDYRDMVLILRDRIASMIAKGMTLEQIMATNDGEMIHAALFTPYRMGNVRHPPWRSPSMSAKSLVVDAPSRKRPKIAPPTSVMIAAPGSDRPVTAT